MKKKLLYNKSVFIPETLFISKVRDFNNIYNKKQPETSSSLHDSTLWEIQNEKLQLIDNIDFFSFTNEPFFIKSTNKKQNDSITNAKYILMPLSAIIPTNNTMPLPK